MSLRLEFVTLALQKHIPFRALAKRFKISPKTGYKWLTRFREYGASGLDDRSRKPQTSPRRTTPEVEQAVVALRQSRGWGGRHLSRALKWAGHTDVPSASTCTDILRRHGLIDPAESAKREPYVRFERAAPNQLWQMDFKGHVPMLRGGRCHPLTVIDDHSRYCVGLEACGDEQGITVQARLTEIFRRHGLPEKILADNGAPWGRFEDSLTTLGVWLMRIGVGLCHGRPWHPQTQGKDERFNRTLKAEVLDRYDLLHLQDFQQRFDWWRRIYNHERPHDALAGHPPSTRYLPSPRTFPTHLPAIQYCPGDIIKTVKQKGEITFRNRTYYIGQALRNQPIALRPSLTDGIYDVFYCWHRLGLIDSTQPPSPKSKYQPLT
jgi:transposase InsO family protein